MVERDTYNVSKRERDEERERERWRDEEKKKRGKNVHSQLQTKKMRAIIKF